MSRPIFLLALAVAAGGALAFLRQGGRTAPEPGDGGVPASLTPAVAPALAPEPEVAAPSPGTELVHPGDVRSPLASAAPASTETTVIHPLRVELSLESRALVPRDEAVPPFRAGANAGVEGTITGRNGNPEAGATVSFIAGPNKGRVLTTDAAGRFGASDLWQGLSIVRVEASARRSERTVRLGRLGRSPLNVDFGELSDSTVNAVVRDGFGKPIEGAEVRIDGTTYYSGPEGDVLARFVTPGKVLISARKDGYARLERELPLARSSLVERDDLVLTLRPAASLKVHVTGGVTSVAPAQLYIFPAGGTGGPGGVTLRDFPWHAVSPVEIFPGQSAVITGLPDDVVNLRLFHPGTAATPASSNVRLHAGQEISHELRLGAAAALRGKVLREGRPVPGAIVALEAPLGTFVTMAALDKKPTYSLEVVVPRLPVAFQETRTDARGSYSLTAYEGIAEGRYLTARTADGRWHGARLVRGPGGDVDVELREVPAEQGELELVLPGRFQGLPVEVQVQGTPRSPMVLRPGEELSIDGLEHGAWTVVATWEGERVLNARSVPVGETPARVEGRLPDGALKGQTAQERARVAARGGPGYH